MFRELVVVGKTGLATLTTLSPPNITCVDLAFILELTPDTSPRHSHRRGHCRGQNADDVRKLEKSKRCDCVG